MNVIETKLYEMLDEVHDGVRVIDHVINPSSENQIFVVLNNIIELRFIAEFYFSIDLETFKKQAHTIDKDPQIEHDYYCSDSFRFDHHQIHLYMARRKIKESTKANLIQVSNSADVEVLREFFQDYFKHNTKENLFKNINLN